MTAITRQNHNSFVFGKKEAHPTEMQAQLGHRDIRTTLGIYTQITDPEVARMVNQVTHRN